MKLAQSMAQKWEKTEFNRWYFEYMTIFIQTNKLLVGMEMFWFIGGLIKWLIKSTDK